MGRPKGTAKTGGRKKGTPNRTVHFTKDAKRKCKYRPQYFE